MSRTSAPTQLHQPQLEVHLPELHPRQKEVLEDPARFKVVVCGRQFGKTSLGAVAAVTGALQGGDVWWVAPTFPIGQHGWNIIDHLCRQVPGTKHEGRPIFRNTLPSGGTIQLASADNPDSLRGATLDGVVFDEAAQAKPEAWPYLRPTLAIRRGWAMFISTPKGLNWFQALYEDAASQADWARWRIPSAESPFMPPGEIEKSRQEMSSLLFSQEYEAEFISGSSMFRPEWIQHYYTRFEDENRLFMLGDETVPESACQKFHTVDLAWSQAEGADYTVIASWAVTPKRHLILLDVVRGHFEGPDIIPKLRLAFERWAGQIFMEKAGHGSPLIQEALRAGLPVRPLKAQQGLKGEDAKIARAALAMARMEQHTVWFPPASTPWYHDFEQEILSFPAGRHDDQVDCLSYAAMQVAKGSDGRGVVWLG